MLKIPPTLPAFLLLLLVAGCSKGVETPAEFNSDIDKQIADVKSRSDIPPQAKEDILKRLGYAKKTPPHKSESSSGN